MNWLAIKTFDLNDNKKEELYIRFISLLSDYVLNIYNSELLLDENDVEVLPNLHRFGYYMYRANQELENSNAVAYIKEMRKALNSCEAMKDLVEFMLEQFKIKMRLT
ncbi:hypothetical protein [Ruminococcus sp. HUN007]|uniref:hypothetical protein n=1 Tax=Ruminococcus sp. HUN007 TaxID=1514668 RepID=UPI0005D2C2EE|nr:hypothetical protein [Ruminococcus sp. HUN007]